MKRIVTILIFFLLLCTLSGARAAECPELIDAVKAGEYEKVKDLVETGCDLNTVCNDCKSSYGIIKQSPSKGVTPLMQAAALNHARIIQLLLDEGADPNLLVGRMSALSVAANLSNYDAAKVLVENDADVDLITKNKDFTALHYCASDLLDEYKLNHKKLFSEYLNSLENGERKEKLKEYEGEIENRKNGIKDNRIIDLKLTELLLKNSSQVDLPDTEGNTPLMILIKNMKPVNVEAVELFIKYGADVNIKNDDQETALSIAEKYGHTDIINILEAAEKKIWEKE
jgi:ankyrin repeat protein